MKNRSVTENRSPTTDATEQSVGHGAAGRAVSEIKVGWPRPGQRKRSHPQSTHRNTMARLARLLCSLLACVGISGCQRSEPSATNSSHPRPESGQIKQLIESFANAPLGESIIEVSRGLAQCNILLPTQDVHE
ncbi:MAG: hypothetical protein KDB11_34430, partial [Planctomycetales bacterium]|nr:hypothetical protein [Planctomycetales bacterium]